MTNARTDPAHIAALNAQLADQSPYRIVEAALQHFGGRLKIAFSGAEDVVLVDFAHQVGGDFEVFCLDTGRLHADTYRFIQTVSDHYDRPIVTMFPQADAVQSLVVQKGLFSFFKDGHKECCGVRKVEPLRRALTGAGAWMTGQRKDQSPQTRAEVPIVQIDAGFSTADNVLVKFNPLANWTSQQVWSYIRGSGIPYNPLHERGFVSIGCEPCTRPVLPGQHEREGRWWWELADDKECGLHVAQPAKVGQ